MAALKVVGGADLRVKSDSAGGELTYVLLG